MWKRSSVVLIVIFFLASVTTAHAASNSFTTGMGNKLRRGIVNTLTGWVEFPAQIIKGYNEGFKGDETNKLLGALCGICDGIGHSVGRTFSGITDLIGFWAADPEDSIGVGIPLDAEHAWEEGQPHDLCDPNITDAAIMPVGKKFLRGLGNGLLGFLELPGQIIKGISQGAYDAGIVKGFWYWYSREIWGLHDIVTAPFPNPKDTAGIAFDEEWPWDTFIKK